MRMLPYVTLALSIFRWHVAISPETRGFQLRFLNSTEEVQQRHNILNPTSLYHYSFCITILQEKRRLEVQLRFKRNYEAGSSI
ncbi:hypothetical protein BT69DRAFT_1283363 [Atractiella rhizophila]|nr:hypothetical protein BT69DRAFT_1283363 [Atractiella rhizophila]